MPQQLHEYLELNVYTKNTCSVSFSKQQGFTMLREQTEENTGHKEFVMLFRPISPQSVTL